MNNFYKLKNFMMHTGLAIFLSLFLLLSASEHSDNQKKQNKTIETLIDRCRQRIKNFPYLNDPFDCLTLEEASQLSYDEKRKLSEEALTAYLYSGDLR